MRNLFIIDLFKIDKINKKMIIIKEPYRQDAIIDIDDEKIEYLSRRYKLLKSKEDEQYITFSQDISDESNASYHLRKRFNEEYGSYYEDVL